MTNQEMIDEMLKMQRALDSAIYKERGVEFDEEKCKLAMIDEIGEFNHEIKASWCWWKKTQKEIERDKALEELVDIWHFALSLTYHVMDEEESYPFMKVVDNGITVSQLYYHIIWGTYDRVESLDLLGQKFGFTLEDVYEAYKKKNQVNYERLAKGY